MNTVTFAVDSGPQLRDAFGAFATGVVVVTADYGGERLGITVSSFNTVSLAPPLISFSIAWTLKSIHAWSEVKEFGVSVLSENQPDISTRFAKSLANKWAGVSVFPAQNVSAQLVSGALMWFECKVFDRYDGGDHAIIIGTVVSAARNLEVEAAPLVFFGGAYRRLVPDREQRIVPHDALWLHGW
jgi:flavin reductase (DIM6/NTAB) family NADH-FMN oxidoreductase RutF